MASDTALEKAVQLLKKDVLPSLDLRFCNHLTGSKLAELSSVLSKAKTLLSMDLWSSNLGPSGIALISDSLPPNLQSLDIGDNNISDAGVSTLLSTFSLTPTIPLRALLLAQNKIGDSGAKSIAQLITLLPSLRRIDLRDNDIRNSGAIAIASSLMTCHLVYISFFHNPIADAGGRALLNALKDNKVLKTVDLRLTLVQDMSILNQIFQITLKNQRLSLSDSTQSNVQSSPFTTPFQLTSDESPSVNRSNHRSRSVEPRSKLTPPSSILNRLSERFVEFDTPPRLERQQLASSRHSESQSNQSSQSNWLPTQIFDLVESISSDYSRMSSIPQSPTFRRNSFSTFNSNQHVTEILTKFSKFDTNSVPSTVALPNSYTSALVKFLIEISKNHVVNQSNSTRKNSVGRVV
ncbi:hypothetical protein RCL1_004067 [Eukaryota sp. TZLM3-RCL]